MEAANYCMGCGCNVQSNECTPAPHQSPGSQYAGRWGQGRSGTDDEPYGRTQEERRSCWRKILISASDYPCSQVRIINNSGGPCIISHCAKEEGSCSVDGDTCTANVCGLPKTSEGGRLPVVSVVAAHEIHTGTMINVGKRLSVTPDRGYHIPNHMV